LLWSKIPYDPLIEKIPGRGNGLLNSSAIIVDLMDSSSILYAVKVSTGITFIYIIYDI
jgi:hypothetical protein